MRRLLPSRSCAGNSKHYRILSRLLLPLFLSLFHLSLYAQETVTGTVIAEGRPVPGVTVTVKGTSISTTTDTTGKYTISVPANAILVFTHISYGTKELAASSAASVTLESRNNDLGEVVVVGYNTQKRATITGSISVLKGSDVVKSPQPNVSNSLAGRFSGVMINNRSGEPGYDGASINIRGLATNGNTDVLIVVDGVPGQIGGLERLNPNDIESFSILKDASAAIYGSRAANGVILITTKRGKTGKPVISADFNQGFSSPTRLPKMADAQTYARIYNEIAYYNNTAGGMNQQYSEAEIQKFADGSDPLNYPNTDWASTVLKKTALQNQANVSVTGGSENVKYFLSLGTLYQDGLYKKGVANYKQYSFRSNIDANVTKDFSVSLYLSGREEDRQYPTSSAGDIFRSIYRAYSTLNAYYPNGLPSTGIEGANPAVMVTDAGGVAKNPQQVFNGILKGNYKISAVKGLSIDGFMAIDKNWNFNKTFYEPYNLYSYDKTSDTYTARIVGGSNNKAYLSESQYNKSQSTYNIKLNYNRTFGFHSINSFVAYEQSEIRSETFGAYRYNYPTTQTPELSQGGTASTDQTNYGSSYHFTRNSFIGKVGYDFSEKYLVEAQLRVDGSTTFPKGNRYGFFPSISAGWRISNESWFKLPYINDLKIRASYGTLGNDNVDLFQYLNNYSFNNQLVLGSSIVPGIDLTKLANENIHWETSRKTDIGVEAVFLKNFNVELIYFRQERSDILAVRNASISAVTGIVNPYGSSSLVPSENIAQINNSGVEATLGYNKRSRKFSYGISGNFTFAKSKVIDIDEAAGVIDYQKQTGSPLNTYLLYKSISIFRTAADLDKYPHLSGAQLGDLIYEDYNKDGQITADDQVRTKYGNIPLITYGFVLRAGYGQFELTAVLAGQAQVSQYVLPESGTVGNFYSSWADNRWSPTHTDGTYPRVDTRASSSVNGGLYTNTFWLNNAAFLRLKNIDLGYNLAGSWLTKLKVQSARVYVNAYNLFTITKVKDYDPEGSSSSGQFYPQQRIVNIGANIRF